MSERITELISSDIEWRVGEIALIKSIAASPSLTDEKKDVALRYSVPAFYSVWEGFVVNAFSEYSKYISSKKIGFDKLNADILAYHSYSTLNLLAPPHEIKKKKKFLLNIYNYIANKIDLSPIVPSDSNVDYDQLSYISKCYAVEPINAEKYKSGLYKLVNYRNRIAHGEHSIKVTENLINEFSREPLI
ncbi:hypothetical protein CAFE_30920 [Caprobacter fermentans]|uniref:MAE-28990/MAE-18760-like HEPN domain-containing protein n=1 Tax=Caproicibacter fermentans TaxID=2576756 RepID=A0A6N8I3P1_9FIRM|nr:MAE_28990/MAE_18760 family HEPN-like nuclease [Caproicibacter fermentans]MVB12357.1 hypothetical protein [Caproicibacter fermentans]